MASSSLAGGIGNEESVCYLCLDGDLDDDGRLLRRDCACRGTDAGFVHLSCLAKNQSKGWDGRDMNEFIKPWETCPGCHQYYQNELAVDIATKFVLFVRGQYPDNTEKQVVSLYLKATRMVTLATATREGDFSSTTGTYSMFGVKM
jgi:hypothetical protein